MVRRSGSLNYISWPVTLAVAFLASTAFPSTAHCAPGNLDPTFGAAGKVVGPSGRAENVAIQNDGDTVLTGLDANQEGELLLRLNPDGSRDTSFGKDGEVTNPAAGRGFSAVILPSDAAIVAAGATPTEFSLAKYKPNGSLDSSFGVGGLVLHRVSGHPFGYGTSIATQSSGKYVVAGTDSTNGTAENNELILMRFDTDGSLDTTFGTNGVVKTTLGNSIARASAIAIQSDDGIVIGGMTGTAACGEFVVARFLADGTADASFGTGGASVVQFAAHECEYARAVAIDGDGQIVAAGSRQYSISNAFYVARLNKTDGALDPSFNGTGKLSFGVGGLDAHPNAIAIESAGDTVGDIVVAGYSAGPDRAGTAFKIARVLPSGSLDLTFGQSGIVSTQFVEGPFDILRYDAANGVALQSDGKIVAGGNAFALDSGVRFAVARYLVEP